MRTTNSLVIPMAFPLIHVMLFLALAVDILWLYWTVFLAGTGLVLASTVLSARAEDSADDGRYFGTAMIGFLLTFLLSASPHWFRNAHWTGLQLAVVTGFPLAVAVLLKLRKSEGPLRAVEFALAGVGGIAGTFLAFYLMFSLQFLASPFLPLDRLSTIDILGFGKHFSADDEGFTRWLRCMQTARCSDWHGVDMNPHGSLELSRVYWELQLFIAIAWDTLLILGGVFVVTALGRMAFIRNRDTADGST
jgi:hypothetical protein